MNFSFLVISYLFLAGAGAGSSLIACYVLIAADRRAELASRFRSAAYCNTLSESTSKVFAASCAALVLGAICLIFDLSRPKLFTLLFLKPSLSFLSLGAFSLTVLIICTTLLALSGLNSKSCLKNSPVTSVARVLCTIFSLCVILYTGFFLYSIYTVRSWHSLLIPALFALSSLSTGIALCYVTVPTNDSSRSRPSNCDFTVLGLIVILGETIMVIMYLVFLAFSHPEAAQSLLSGSPSSLFWGGYVLCGLVIPVCMNIFIRRYGTPLQTPLAFMLAIGGFSLRACIVLAGFPS